MGGRAQRLPPRCIADNDDGGLCFEPVVVVVVVVVGHYGLEFVDGTGAAGVGALLFIVVLDFVDGAGGVGAVRGGNL